MTKFNPFMRCDPNELAQRIAYFESLNKERQLDFIISDYYSARVDNEDFDRRKAHETERAEYEKYAAVPKGNFPIGADVVVTALADFTQL